MHAEATPPSTLRTLMQGWRRTLFRASPAYWALQAVVFVGSILVSAVLLQKIVGSGGASSQAWIARMALEAWVFFLVTHAGLRPALRLFFFGQVPRWPAWLGLLAWILVLSLLSLGATLAIDSLKLMQAGTITSVRFDSEGAEFGVSIEGPQFYVLAVANLASTLCVWTALYLGWHAFRQRRRLQQQVRQARLDQLTRQLNPHFLFNAFNTIRGTIFEDPQRAADLVTQLSELFRFHLSQAERSTQTLEEEWRLAQRYLAIEQARLEQRLRVNLDLDPICMSRSLPSLALLLLVENAIKHGIAPRPEGGELLIRARPQADHWWLEVVNPLSSDAHADGTRTGLANLRERLQLGYGDAARLELQALSTQFRARICLPWRSSGEGA
ncbi:MAG: histidine kinase [Xanthomonadales bacterium]|nr:histidine kinase [Xanthomonadales bacterium]